MSGIDQVSVLRIKLFTTFTTNDRQAKLYIYYKGQASKTILICKIVETKKHMQKMKLYMWVRGYGV